MNFEEAVEAMRKGHIVANERFTELWLADFGRTYRDNFGDVDMVQPDTWTKKKKVRGLAAADKKSKHWYIKQRMNADGSFEEPAVAESPKCPECGRRYDEETC